MKAFDRRNIIIMCILVALLVMVLIPTSLSTWKLPQKVYGKPQVIYDEVVFNKTRIEQVLDDGIYMYVLADDHQGYIQIYDLNGQYHATWFFYDSINGTFSMAVEDEMLYVKDGKRNVYIFSNGQFQQFLPESETSLLLAEMKFNNASVRYKIRFGSIWRVDLQKPVCVVQRGIQGCIYQYYLDFVFIALICIVIMIVVKKRNAFVCRNN